MKKIIYNTLSSILKVVLKNQIIGKNIKGTNKKLYYERLQHLTFLKGKEIDYESYTRSKILERIAPGNLVFDVGSNIGQYALLFGDVVGEKGKVICLEPDPKNFAFLQFNINMNSVKNSEALNVGIGSEEATLKFYRDTTTGGRRGSFEMEFVGDSYEGSSLDVPVITLDSLIEKHGEPDFMKIDVEGHEMNVLSGIKGKLSKTTVMIEVRLETKNEVFDFFNNLGYDCFLFGNNTLSKVSESSGIKGFANLLFVPN